MKLRNLFLLTVPLVALYAGVHSYQHKQQASRPWLTEDKIRKTDGAPERYPAYANCPNLWEGSLEIDGKARAHGTRAESASRIVQSQLKYLNGYFNHDQAISSDFKVYMRPGAKFEIHSQKKVRYGRDLAMDSIVSWDSFKAGGKVGAQDPAIEVSYYASQPIAICGLTPNPPARIQIKLPYDPDLAFWFVPKSSRRMLQFQGSKSLTNPCAFEEMADLKAPSMYWYVWNPDASGTATDGTRYDCHDILKPGSDYLVSDARFAPAKPEAPEVDYRFLKSPEPLQLHFYFGVMSTHHDPREVSSALEALRKRGSVLQAADEILNSKAASSSELDPGFIGMLHFIRTMAGYFDLGSSRIEERQGYFEIHMPLGFRRSGQKAEMTVYFGPTDQPQQVAHHWAPLLKSFETADFIFYVGHAGMGANLSLAELQKTLGLKPADLQSSFTRKKYQFLGIISCYGSAFYGDDYADLRKGPGLTTDVLLTASSRYLVGIPTGFLYYLDLSLNGDPVSLSKTLSLFLPPQETAFIHRYP
jgi:hypothetical protein